MAWSSHAFHILTQVQTFAAAVVALGAAGLTFYSQKRTSERQAETAIETLNIKEKQDRVLADEAIHRFRTSYLLKMSVALSDLKLQTSFRAQQADLFSRSASEGKHEGTLVTLGVDIAWNNLVRYRPLAERHPILLPSMNDLERLPTSVQQKICGLQIIIVDIDMAVSDMANFHKQCGFVLTADPYAIRQQCVNAISLIDGAEDEIEKQLRPYELIHPRSTKKIETVSVLNPESENYRHDLAEGFKRSRKYVQLHHPDEGV